MKKIGLVICLLTAWLASCGQSYPIKIRFNADTVVCFSISQTYKLAEAIVELQACTLQVAGLEELLTATNSAVEKRDSVIEMDNDISGFKSELIQNYSAELDIFKNRSAHLQKKNAWLKVQRVVLCVGIVTGGALYLVK